jgi:hypothetical protein
MISVLVFLVSLGTIVGVSELRDWLARRSFSQRTAKLQALTPSKWSKDVLSYYKQTSTRRQLS